MTRIIVRDDDVLLPSSGHADPFARLIKVHKIIVEASALHVPAILCGSIQQFPEAIEFIRNETKEGRMRPEIHGWEHIDYGKLSFQEVKADLQRCKEWMITNLDCRPTKFYTPWGASSNTIKAASIVNKLEMIDCSNIVPPRKVNNNPEQYKDVEEIELFIHWWEGVNRLKRALHILNGDTENG